MEPILRLYFTTTLLMRDSIAARRRDDRGQASTEYAGVLFVIVAIISALVALTYTEVGDAIKQRIVTAVQKVGSSV